MKTFAARAQRQMPLIGNEAIGSDGAHPAALRQAPPRHGLLQVGLHALLKFLELRPLGKPAGGPASCGQLATVQRPRGGNQLSRPTLNSALPLCAGHLASALNPVAGLHCSLPCSTNLQHLRASSLSHALANLAMTAGLYTCAKLCSKCCALTM